MGRLVNQAIYLTVEKVAHIGGGLLLLVAVARLLGEAALGDYAFAIAATALFVPFLDAGLNNRAIKRVSQIQDWQAVSEALAFRLRIGPWLLAAMVVIAWALDKSWDVVLAVILIGISTLAMSLGDAANAGFKGQLQAQYSAFCVGITNVSLVGLSVWAMVSGCDVIGVAVAYMLCRIGYCVGSMLVLKVSIWTSEKFDRETFLQSVGFLPAVFFIECLLHVNFLAADRLGDGMETGFYAIGYRMASALYVLGGASLEAVLALFSRRSEHDHKHWIKGWMLLGGTGTGLVQWLAEPATIWIFGEAFRPAVECVKLLGWTLPAFLLLGFSHTVLLATGQERKAIQLMFLFLATGIIAGVVGFILWGAVGTAFSPTITGWIFALIVGRAASKKIKKDLADCVQQVG